MGREIKRVPANFDWPLEKVWKGFIDPYWPKHEPCGTCGRYNPYSRKVENGDGLTPAAREIADSFYDHGWRGGYPSPNRWCDKITQEEVNLLVEEERLWEFTTRIVNLDEPDEDGRTWKRERVLNEDGTPFIPTAEQINERQRRSFVHDAINAWILKRHRWKKAGLTEDHQVYCHECKGEGYTWPDPQDKVRHENFNERDEGDPSIGQVWSEPPEGPWWQVWETVSEGSPVTPAFATAEELVDYLVKNGDAWCQKRPDERPPTREAAENFVKHAGWVPSGMSSAQTGMVTGIQQAALYGKE